MSDAGIFRFLKLKGQPKTTRILLVHGHSVLIDRIEALLKNTPNNTPIQKTSSTWVALDIIQKDSIDLIISDFNMNGMFDLSFINSLRRANPYAKILVLSAHDEVRFINEIFLDGVQGYVLTKDLDKELLTAIKDVVDGKRFVSFELNELLVHLNDNPNVAEF